MTETTFERVTRQIDEKLWDKCEAGKFGSSLANTFRQIDEQVMEKFMSAFTIEKPFDEALNERLGAEKPNPLRTVAELIEEAVQAERDACAIIADTMPWDGCGTEGETAMRSIATAIRARGETNG